MFQHDPSQTIEASIYSALFRLTQLFHQNQQLTKDLKLSSLQIQILHLLFTASHPMTLTDLSKKLDLAKSTLSVSVKSLKQHCLIEKQRDSQDGRKIILLLTPTGHQHCQQLSGFHSEILASLSGLSSSRRTQLLKSLLEFLHQLQLNGLIDVKGICFECVYFNQEKNKPYCELLHKPMAKTAFPVNWYQPSEAT